MTTSYLPAPTGYVARFARPTDDHPSGVEHIYLPVTGFATDGSEPLTLTPPDFSDEWTFDAAFFDRAREFDEPAK